MKKKKPFRIQSGNFEKECRPSDGSPPFVLSAQINLADPSINTDILRGYGDRTHPKDSQYISDAGCYCQKCGDEITIKNK